MSRFIEYFTPNWYQLIISLSLLMFFNIDKGFTQPIIFADTFAYNISGVPNGWNVVSINDAGPNTPPGNALWSMTLDGKGSNGFHWENRPAIESPTASSGAIIFNSDFLDNGGTGIPCDPNAATSCTPHEGLIISPKIDVSGFFDVSVRFNQYFRGFGSETFLEVSDDSVNWIPFQINQEISQKPFGGETPPDDVQQFNLSDIAGGKQNVWLRFRFRGDYYFWIIDDLVLFGGFSRDLAVTEIISPNKDLETCLWNSEEIISVKLKNYGTMPDSNFFLSALVNNHFFSFGNFPGVIHPNEEVIFTFPNQFAPDTTFSIEVIVGDPSFPAFDNNPFNNQIFCPVSPCCIATDPLGGNYVCDQIIVKFPPSTTPAQRTAIRDSFDTPPTLIDSCRCNEFELWDMQFPNIFDNDTITNVNEGVSLIKARPGVKDAGKNYLPELNQPLDSLGIGPPYQAPKDSNASKRVVVGVIDTGLDFGHDSLDDNFWVNPIETSDIYANDADSNCYVQDNLGMNFLSHTEIPQDDNSHGNHVGGSIVNHLPNDLRIELESIKAQAGNGKGTLFDLICALYYAIDTEVDLVNMSVGYTGELSSILDTAVFDAESRDLLIIASAGNDSLDNAISHHWPSGFSQYFDSIQGVIRSRNVISIAAYDTLTNQLAGFSNYSSSKVDIAAPGVDIYSTGLGENSMAFKSGTSMAAALVSRVAALYISCNPDASWSDVKSFLLDSALIRPELVTSVANGRLLNPNDDIYFDCAPPLSIDPEEKAFQADVIIFPNPNKGIFTLEILEANSSLLLLDLMNILGQRVYSEKMELLPPQTQYQLDLTHLSEGVYYIRLRLEGQQKVIQMEVRR